MLDLNMNYGNSISMRKRIDLLYQMLAQFDGDDHIKSNDNDESNKKRR